MDVYEYGDNFVNLPILHVDGRLFKLMDHRWWFFYDDIVHASRYGNPYRSRSVSNRWWAHKHSLRSPTPIHLHCAFRRSISAEWCGTPPHTSRVTTGFKNSLQTSDTFIGHLNTQTWTFLSIFGNCCSHNLVFRRDLLHHALLWFWGDFFLKIHIICEIPTNISRVGQSMPCRVTTLLRTIYNIRQLYKFFWHLNVLL